ncbi:phosphotransferase [Gorillibacterium sp. CAU 1737]|uniref:phosphotransferase n=1 Tax=Gorillibacterium sp. CAU 1737 TaxID=3140362 RepID=UPI003260174F
MRDGRSAPHSGGEGYVDWNRIRIYYEKGTDHKRLVGRSKYCVTTTGGTNYLLRISPSSQYETKRRLFSVMEQIAALDIPMCLPIEFGTCEDGVYSIQSWIDGVDLETILPLSSETLLSKTEQYTLGLQSGEIAKKIHTIPVAEPQEEWAEKFNREIDRKLWEYNKCGLRIDGDAHFFAYVEESRHFLKDRPQCFTFILGGQLRFWTYGYFEAYPGSIEMV